MRKKNRICKQCSSGEIESESHFLLICTKYKSLREDLFYKLQSENPQFRIQTDAEKLRFLLNPQNSLNANYISDFVYRCFNIRNLNDKE